MIIAEGGGGLTGNIQKGHCSTSGERRRVNAMTTSTSPATNAAASRLTRPDGSPLRALVVDDEPMLADLLSMALRYDGWEVRAAATGIAGVRAVREFAPDVVLLDVMLPDIDGLEVLRRLRGTDPDIPVLFLTARDAVEDRIAGIT